MLILKDHPDLSDDVKAYLDAKHKKIEAYKAALKEADRRLELAIHTLDTVNNMAKLSTGHRLMQIAEPFRKIVNVLNRAIKDITPTNELKPNPTTRSDKPVV